MTTAENLFKFVALRPVQKASEGDLRRRFIKYSLGQNQPQLYEQLLAKDNFEERKELAATYIKSQNYVSGFNYNAPWVSFLRQLHDYLMRIKSSDNALDQARTEAKQWLENNSEQFVKIKEQLWSSIYAVTIDPYTLPGDSKELLDLTRTSYFLENHDSFTERAQIAALLAAKPLVPNELIDVPAAGVVTEENPDSPTWQKQKLDQFNQLSDQVYTAQYAIEEIETAERRSLNRQKKTPAAVTRESIQLDDNTTIHQFSGPPATVWTLPADAVDSLSNQTKSLLQRHNISVTEDSTLDILHGLGRIQRDSYASIFQLGGLQAVKTAELMRISTNTNKQTLEPQLLNELTDKFDIPWLFPQDETRFDETIVGSVGSVKPVGIGDLLVVKETIMKYEVGEVAHIENVLQSESKDRIHRRLDRTEQTIFSETETTSQSERDLQTTERFELQTEIQSTLQRDSEIGLGIEVSGGFGPVKITTNAEFATSTSQSDSSSAASSYAQEITDRSVESLTERIKESLTTSIVTEIEETNTHGFDNSAGSDHICGIYRWVDKYYLSQVYNYGRRLMFEFIVPEPASFYLHARNTNASSAGSLSPPEPLDDDFSFTDIKPGNYETWVDAYQVSNVSPPPPMYTVVGKAIDEPAKDLQTPTTKADSLTIPAGYVAREGHIHYSYNTAFENECKLAVVLGRRHFRIHDGETFNTLDDEDSIIPIAINTNKILSYGLTIEVKCKRSDETLQAWQLSTYNAVIEAYSQQKAAYQAQIAAQELSQGVTITGNNPDQNRIIEQEELKRGCLTLFTDQHFADFNATKSNVAPHGYPEFDVNEAMTEARYIQFYDQIFEWEKMSYLFYPYFWGRKEEWVSNSQHDDIDPKFANFLKAGSARVLVPVRRNYEESVLYYLITNPGQIWNGGEMPTINNELYVSIVNELMADADADLADATPVGDPWEIKLPTELVKLQQDSELPDWSSDVSAEVSAQINESWKR